MSKVKSLKNPIIKKFTVELDGGEEVVVSRDVLQKWFVMCDGSWFTISDEGEMIEGDWVYPNVAGITCVSSAMANAKADIDDVNIIWPLGFPAACNGDPLLMPTISIVWSRGSSSKMLGYISG